MNTWLWYLWCHNTNQIIHQGWCNRNKLIYFFLDWFRVPNSAHVNVQSIEEKSEACKHLSSFTWMKKKSLETQTVVVDRTKSYSGREWIQRKLCGKNDRRKLIETIWTLASDFAYWSNESCINHRELLLFYTSSLIVSYFLFSFSYATLSPSLSQFDVCLFDP